MELSIDAASRPQQRAGRQRRPVSAGRLLLWLVLIIGAVPMVLPFYWMITTSLKTGPEIAGYPPTWFPETFTIEHWQSLGDLDIGDMPTFFRNSIFVVTAITALTLASSAITGYIFAKFRFPGRDTLFLIVLGLLIVPLSVTLVPLYDLMVQWGWTNTYLALIVPIIYNPFGIFLMRQFMMEIPDELIDAARIDGASELGIFLRIVLPLSGAPLAALAIFTFTIQWDNFLWPLVVLDRPDLYTLPLGLAQFRGRTGIELGPMTAASSLAVLPVLIVYLFAQRRFVEGIALTGLKR